MPKYAYSVIEVFEGQAPEPFGTELLDHHPEVGEVVQLHWISGQLAHRVKVCGVDPGRLQIHVLAADDGSEDQTEESRRLKAVGLLVGAFRDKLQEELGETGVALAVIARTMDGTSVQASLRGDILNGSEQSTNDLVDVLHRAMDEFLNRLPAVSHRVGQIS